MIKLEKIIINMNNKYFETNDLALSAALLCKDLSIINIDNSNPRKVIFIFENNSHTKKLIDKYWKHELLVDPLEYFNALKELKTRIYEYINKDKYDNTRYQKT